MFLKICYSDRVEVLAEETKRRLLEERATKGPKGQFEFLNVAVAHPNLGNEGND